MNILNRLFRYSTFALAITGMVMMGLVIKTIKAQERPMPPPPVAPSGKPYASTVAATGILEAIAENVSIGTPVSGLVMEVMVKVNESVNVGQPLMKMDDRELQAQLIRMRAQVELAKAKMEVNRATLAKLQDMLERVQAVSGRAVSVDEVQQRQNDLKVGQAQLLAAEAELNAASADMKQTEMLIDRMIVKAPRAGTILQLNIRAGEYAATSPKAPVMVLGNLEELQVRADVDEQSATRIRPGQKGTAYIKGDTKNPIPLTFVRVEPYVIPKTSLTGASTERVDTRVLQVIYSLQRPKTTPIYVGQQVDVYIDAGSGESKS